MLPLVATPRRRRGGRRAFWWWPATLLLVALGCGGRAPASYDERIERHRAAKDAFLGNAADSPILPEDRDEFLPLAYFAVDESYHVAAVPAPSEREPAIEMPTSTGLRRQMRRAGTLRFSLKGEPMTLTALVEADDTTFNRLFVPFADLTNGTETYAAGRYIDLDRTATGMYELDFNLAYHPYCYYNERYDCPFPPPENRLQTPVRAGERLRSAR
jgi:uncharacterized protein